MKRSMSADDVATRIVHEAAWPSNKMFVSLEDGDSHVDIRDCNKPIMEDFHYVSHIIKNGRQFGV